MGVDIQADGHAVSNTYAATESTHKRTTGLF